MLRIIRRRTGASCGLRAAPPGPQCLRQGPRTGSRRQECTGPPAGLGRPQTRTTGSPIRPQHTGRHPPGRHPPLE
eukprot:9379314-Heterocapsa_arctica.AAC.1